VSRLPPPEGQRGGEPGSLLSRRTFLVASTGAGLAFGFSALVEAAMDPAVPGGAPMSPTGPRFEPTLWFAIDGDGIVTVNIIRAEMGQHVGTALARILADELDVAWDKVKIVHVDTDPKWGLMVTGGSWSVWQTFPIFSQAGAAGRIALVEAGAKLLNVSPAGGTARAAWSACGRQVDLVWRHRQARRRGPTVHPRRTGQAADQAGSRAQADRQAGQGNWTSPPRSTVRRSTASTPRSRAWSSRGPSCRRPATSPR
jgi:CO/xanthine dehydrogenase Mo-binding subunit